MVKPTDPSAPRVNPTGTEAMVKAEPKAYRTKIKSSAPINPVQPVEGQTPAQGRSGVPTARQGRASSAADAQRLGKIAGTSGGPRGLWGARNTGPVQIGNMTFKSVNDAMNRIEEYDPSLDTLERAFE